MDSQKLPTPDLQTRAVAFEKELQALLDKHNLTAGIIPDFPIYRILPAEVKLALEIIKKHGVVYLHQYADKK